MSEVTLTKAVDTYASAGNPLRPLFGTTRLAVRSGQANAFVYFSRPFPIGARIMSATLRLYSQAGSGSGSRTLSLARLKDKPVFSRLTWKNQPDIVNPVVSVSKPAASADGVEWAFDVKTHMQQISDGLPWTGWRVTSSMADLFWLYAAESQGEGSKFAPVLEVEWSDAPEPPEDLSPSDGLAVSVTHPTLQFGYVDVSGNTTLKSVHVNIAEDRNFTTGLWNSGEVPAQAPELDLSSTSFPGLGDGASRYWRVRVRDADEEWSGWSAPALMKRTSKGALALTEPNANVIMDPTPVVAWTLTGRTQRAYRIRVRRAADPKRDLWDSKVVPSSETAVEVPAGVVTADNAWYRIILDVWDTVNRVATPGDLVQYQVRDSFVFDQDAAVPTVEYLSSTALNPAPGVELEWAHVGTAPDQVAIVRNGEVVATLDPLEHRDVDGAYRWVDRTARPRVELTYAVRNVVGRRQSRSGASAYVISEPTGVWLTTPSSQVRFLDKDIASLTLRESSEVHEVGDRVVVVTHHRGGFFGAVEQGLLIGEHTDQPGVSTEQWRDRFLAIRNNPKHARLVLSDLNIPVVLANMSLSPTPDEDLRYHADVQIWQSGAFEEYGL